MLLIFLSCVFDHRYTEEYALLISEAQAIKQELSTVEAKVTRSTNLLKSLSIEQERWEQTSESFKSQVKEGLILIVKGCEKSFLENYRRQ